MLQYQSKIETLNNEFEASKVGFQTEINFLAKKSLEYQIKSEKFSKYIEFLENRNVIQKSEFSRETKELNDKHQLELEKVKNVYIKDLEETRKENKELTNKVNQLNEKRPALIGGDSIWAYGGYDNSLEVTHGGLNVTQWYERLLISEKTLKQEQQKRLELENYFSQTLKVNKNSIFTYNLFCFIVKK